MPLFQAENIGSDFILTAGFSEVADANDLVILFPSIAANAEVGNDSGCWNVFGFLDDLEGNVYASREAKQVRNEEKYPEASVIA